MNLGQAERKKTIDDVTREELGDLAEAAMDLLAAARMLIWLHGYEDAEDQSFMDSGRRMERALSAIGLPQRTFQEFSSRIESMLNGDLLPHEWRALMDAKTGPPI